MPGVQVASADCEARDDWFVDQDVAAWTSFAFVAVGLYIVFVVVRNRLPRAFVALGALVVLEGVGSLLYHGIGGDVAQLLHDAPLVGLLGFVAGWHVGRLAQRASAGALVGLISGLAARGDRVGRRRDGRRRRVPCRRHRSMRGGGAAAASAGRVDRTGARPRRHSRGGVAGGELG